MPVPGDQVAGEQRAVRRRPRSTGSRACGRASRARAARQTHARRRRRPLDAGQVGVADERRAGARAQRDAPRAGDRTWRWVTSTVVIVPSGCAPRRGWPPGGAASSGPGSIDGQLARAVADQVGIGARQRHRARVRREHALDQHDVQRTRSRQLDLAVADDADGTRGTRQSVPGQQLRPLVTSQRQPCHGTRQLAAVQRALATAGRRCAGSCCRARAARRRRWPARTSASPACTGHHRTGRHVAPDGPP